MADYLMPRRVVARAQVFEGIGIVEAVLLVGAAGLGLGLQALLGVLPLHGTARLVLIVLRAVAAVLPPGAVWMMLRPAPGGRVWDYVRAMARYGRAQGGRPWLWSRCSGGQ